MKYAILGSGMMGYALAFDLARSRGVTGITLVDADADSLDAAIRRLHSPLLTTVRMDLDSPADLGAVLAGHACVISAVPYRYNAALTDIAINAGVHFCDLGGNDAIVAEQFRMHQRAIDQNVLVLPNCGLAPGLANILAARGVELFESADEVYMRVGGLPQHPKPPLNYQLVFSVEGLLNEYSGKAKVLRQGEIAEADAMSEIEAIDFPAPFGTLEAFHTSGGSSRLTELLRGKVRELDYKTIRYQGHCERMKTLLDLGFSSNEPIQVGHGLMTAREVFMELLKKRLEGTDPDVTILRVDIKGVKDGKSQRLRFEFIDFYDKIDQIPSMGRTTAFPTSAIAQLVAAGEIAERGVHTPEECIPLEPLLAELKSRQIPILMHWN